MEEYCVVCAEPIQFTAYGPCGHKDACSKCIIRLRVVLEDKRCVICQQMHDSVFVTKNLGDFTPTLPATAFPELQARERRGELKSLRDANAYFEDEDHFQNLRQLCSFTHPDLAELPEDVPRQYRGLKALKETLRTHLHRHFCDVCLEGRKVFLAEQVLYSKQQLNSHKQHGDREGPLAESGFTGHCLCRFCNKWHYGENELWKHMAENHESCFLCKRSNPDRHVYYKDYEELEEHFRHEHYLCEDNICRQERFQVWSTEAELHQHRVKVHGDHMSRHEKRQAMRIPLDINFRRAEEGGQGSSAGPSGTTIGGAGGVRSRFRLREPNHRRDQNQIADAIQASLDSANAEAAQRDSRQQALAQAASERQAFNAEDFPSVSGVPGSSGVVSGGRWAAAGGAAGGRINAEDFPALPGTSKSAKKRAKAKERTLAQRVGTQGQVRVINRSQATTPNPPARAAPQTAPSTRPAPAADLPSATESSAAEDTASDASFSADELSEDRFSSPLQQPRGLPSSSPMGQEAFPPLPQAQPRQAPPSGLQARPFINPLAAKAPAKGKASKSPATKGPYQAPPSADDFPSLSSASTSRRPLGGPSNTATSAADPSQASQNGNTAASSGVSDALKAANKAVIDKVRQRVSAEDFSQFKQESGRFLRGDASAKDFHTKVVSLGLAALLPELAALCPDATKRNDLLEVHRKTFVSEAAAKGGGGWVPPEAAAAAAEHATRFSSWGCPSCTLINAPEAFSCEACNSLRPSSNSAAQQDNGLTSSSSYPSLADGDGNRAEDKGKKKGKAPKFERLRLTGGDAVATQNWLDTAGGQRTKPQNVWTHKAPTASNTSTNGNLSQKQKAASNAWTN